MINLKEVAETLLQVVNNQEQLKSIVDLMESSNNTVRDDISKLREGAKLKPEFDLNKMFELADSIMGDISEAQDYCSDAENAALEARGCLDDADYNASELRNMIEYVQHEITDKKDEVIDEKDE
mgnify:CR=1 FL=1